MREGLTTAGEITGGLVVAAGFYSIAHPAGLIVGGALLAFYSWLVAR